VVQIMKQNLEKRGYGVLVANNGEAAYETCIEHRPDLVISDYQMPVLDGLGLCLRLKTNPKTAQIPVLMLTARGHILEPSELARINVRAVIAKPFSIREVVVKIEEALRGDCIDRRKAV
jgi:DNA-binding response OmpR family regulator